MTGCWIETASTKKHAGNPLWNIRLNRKMWELYLRNDDGGMPEYATPMLTIDFSSLLPAYAEI